MPGTAPPPTPAPGERGLASHRPLEVAELLEPAWASLEAVAADLDLDAPTRVEGTTVRTALVRLATWEGEDALDRRVAAARRGVVEPGEDHATRQARLLASHGDTGREELLEALRRSRTSTSAYLLGDDVAQTGTAWVSSVVGDLPLTGLVVARAYELALTALDLVAAGAPEPAPEVLTAGLAALVDVTGALAARHGLSTAFAVRTPVAGWVVGARDGDWTTARIGPGDRDAAQQWAGVAGTAADVLDASAGRRPAAQLLLSRRLRAHDVPALLQLLPVVEGVPGLPGGGAVRAAVRLVAGAGRGVSVLSTRLPGGRRTG